MDKAGIINAVHAWVENPVIELNLCPFAKRELVRNRVRFEVTGARTEDELLTALQSELLRLNDDPAVETTLLIHPYVLQNFYDYNQFLDVADALLVHLELEGVYQIASFHPDYQFGGTAPQDAENYTNRSPYPILHLLREASLERALESYPGAERIPERNIRLLNELGGKRMQAILRECFDRAQDAPVRDKGED